MGRLFTFLTITTGLTLAGIITYAVYFDFKRRNDTQFRKRIRKENKRFAKTVAQDTNPSDEKLLQAIQDIKKEEIPKSKEEEERYFFEQVELGDQLARKGPAFVSQAAECFFRGLRAYPNQMELLAIYQKIVPEPVYNLVMAMVQLEAKDKAEGYYKHFPPKQMNVSCTIERGRTFSRRILVAAKDFEAGELIYKEQPVSAALDYDLEGKRAHCSQCFKAFGKGAFIVGPSDRLSTAYCSNECQHNAKSLHHNILFADAPSLPLAISPPQSPDFVAERLKVQGAFITHLQKEERAIPLIMMRLIARQIMTEIVRMVPNAAAMPPPDYPQPDVEGYNLNEHLERLRYLEIHIPEEETKLAQLLLETAMPGLAQFVSDERHTVMFGRVAYNTYGVYFGDGRDDKPTLSAPEKVEMTRTPRGTSRQVGSAFYIVSSYIGHSCVPSTRPSFPNGTTELHLFANRAIKKGEEITVAFVDVTQRPDETPSAARRRRRTDLFRGWRFVCRCERCLEEGAEGENGADNDIERNGGPKDESKVMDISKKFEALNLGNGQAQVVD